MDLERNDIFHILHTTRAMRRLRPDPVPDEIILRIIAAGLCAANGANSQQWRFLVIKDPEIKSAVQKIYKRAFDEFVKPRYEASTTPPGMTTDKFKRQLSAVEYLTDHFHEAPVWIVPCDEVGVETRSRQGLERSAGASIYPAVQNMLLAARALGLGATLTTRHLAYAEESEAAMRLPRGVRSFAVIPLGYPLGNFGPVSRGAVETVTFLDRWGVPYREGTSG
jgi:nitroreductase